MSQDPQIFVPTCVVTLLRDLRPADIFPPGTLLAPGDRVIGSLHENYQPLFAVLMRLEANTQWVRLATGALTEAIRLLPQEQGDQRVEVMLQQVFPNDAETQDDVYSAAEDPDLANEFRREMALLERQFLLGQEYLIAKFKLLIVEHCLDGGIDIAPNEYPSIKGNWLLVLSPKAELLEPSSDEATFPLQYLPPRKISMN